MTSVAALPRLVTGNTSINYSAVSAREGVLLTQLPQHLPTILKSWKKGESFPDGPKIQRKSVLKNFRNLHALLSEVSEVRKVLGEQQLQQMQQQVTAARSSCARCRQQQHKGGSSKKAGQGTGKRKGQQRGRSCARGRQQQQEEMQGRAVQGRGRRKRQEVWQMQR
jgi:hypothetical protein